MSERDNTLNTHALTIKQLTALRATISERLKVIEDPILADARSKLTDLNVAELRQKFEEITRLRLQKLPTGFFNKLRIRLTDVRLYITSLIIRHASISGVLFAALLTFIPVIALYRAGIIDKTGLGPVIGGISLWLAAVGLWIQAHIITERNSKIERYMRAVSSFRVLYDEFWGSKNIALARRWIVSSEEYKQIKQALAERNKSADRLNHLPGNMNAKLDIIDQFFAVLVRIKSFTYSGELDDIEPWQRELWIKILHGKWWIEFIDKNRPELSDYVKENWKEFAEFLNPATKVS